MEKFNLAEINPTISRVKVKIVYPGKNKKKFEFDKDVLENMIPSLKGTPILAYYSETHNEIGGHEGDLARTKKGLMKTGKLSAYGFVDPVNEPWFEIVKEADGTENEYLTTYGYLWSERFKKETSLIKDSGQSMEISIIDANMVEGYIKTKMAHFIGLTALNKDGVTPTFESSAFEAFSSEDVTKELEFISQEIVKISDSANKENVEMSCDWLNTLIQNISDEHEYSCTEEDSKEIFEEFKGDYEEFAIPEKYDHVNFKPTVTVSKSAKRGLNLRADQPESNKCCTGVGLARARQLSNRQQLSPSTIKRMKSYFDRHEVDKKGEGWGVDSKGYQAWLLWGGDPAYRWVKKIVKQMDKADEESKKESFAIDNKIEVSLDPDKKIEGTVGEKDIGSMKKKVLESSNKAEAIPKIFARHPDDLSGDIIQDDLGYPLMSERDGVFYYNTGFIKAASSRIEQQKDQPYYDKVRKKILEARKKVNMTEEFNMKGDVARMEYGMMKDMYAKYGMNRYMYAKKDDNYMYAMDMEEMKPVKMAYEMKEEMAVPMMDNMEMAEDMMMDKEDMAKMLRIAHEMYMEKMHGYMSLEEEKDTVTKEKEELFSQNEKLNTKVTEFEEKKEKFSKEFDEFTTEKNKLEAEKVLGHEDFSVLTGEDREGLINDVTSSTNMIDFKTKVEAFSFRKAKEIPEKEKDVSFSINPKDTVIKEKKDSAPKDLYASIKEKYNY